MLLILILCREADLNMNNSPFSSQCGGDKVTAFSYAFDIRGSTLPVSPSMGVEIALNCQ